MCDMTHPRPEHGRIHSVAKRNRLCIFMKSFLQFRKYLAIIFSTCFFPKKKIVLWCWQKKLPAYVPWSSPQFRKCLAIVCFLTGVFFLQTDRFMATPRKIACVSSSEVSSNPVNTLQFPFGNAFVLVKNKKSFACLQLWDSLQWCNYPHNFFPLNILILFSWETKITSVSSAEDFLFCWKHVAGLFLDFFWYMNTSLHGIAKKNRLQILVQFVFPMQYHNNLSWIYDFV